MRVTMVKKRLADGSWCKKCGEAEELLRNRNLWQRIDRVAVADEADPDSPGWRLAAHFQVEVAPFFIVEDDGAKTAVYTSALQLVRAISPRPVRTRAGKHAVLDDTAVSRFSSLFAEKHPQKCIKWALETFGRDCSIAFSGAEDVVLIDMASRTGLDFSVFVLDTGRLHPETYAFIGEVRKRYRLELDVMSPDGAILEAFVRAKGLFSFYDDGHQECCGIRKVEPLRRALKIRPAWITGQRRDQSPTRADVATVEFDPSFKGAGQDGQLVKVNPLAVWTEQQVWDYIRAFELPYNPLHEKGFRSIGCAPCTRPTHPGQHPREGRWWWEEATTRECGLHIGNLRQKVGADEG